MVEERCSPYESERCPGREDRTSHWSVVETDSSSWPSSSSFKNVPATLLITGFSCQFTLENRAPLDPAAVPCVTYKFQCSCSVCDLQSIHALLSSSPEMIQVKYIARYTFLLLGCHDQVLYEVITIPLSFYCHQPLLTKALNDRFDLQERLMLSQ